MRLFSTFTTALLCGALFFATVEIVQAQNRTGERDDFRNTSYVRTDDDEMKTYLFLADEAARNGNHPERVANLVRALRRGGDALVAFGDRTYMTGRNAATQRIAALPPEAFRLYLETIVEESQRVLDRALAGRNGALLADGAARFPFARKSFAALRMLGDLARERGDWLEAAGHYKRYLEQADLAADRSVKEEKATAGAAEWDSFEGELASVKVALTICLFRSGQVDDAAATVTSGTVRVGGREISANDLMALFAPETSGSEVEGAWPTRGGARSRSRLPAFDSKTLRLLWSYSFEDDGEEEGRDVPVRSLPERLRLGARRMACSTSSVVYDGGLYVFDEHRLYALDVETGETLFGPLPWDWSLLFGDRRPDLENVTYSGTVEDGVLYVTLNHRGRRGGHKGSLLALDLTRDGLCLWKRSNLLLAAVGREPGSAVAFSGAPVVMAGRVYLMATCHGSTESEAWVLCFDASDGTLLFEQFLCSGVEVQRFGGRSDLFDPEARDRVELGAPIVERAGRLYCLTNLGVAAALDAFSGEILWLFKYNRIFAQDPDTYTRAFFLDNGGWEDSLPLFRDNRLIFAPSDSRYLYTLSTMPDPDGYIVLDDPVEKGRFVSFLGTDGKLYYFAAREGGRNFIAAANRSGALAWETDLFESRDRITGRPFLTQSAVFVPTLRYIYRVDLAAEGLITHCFPAPLPADGKHKDLPEPLFGNIITTNDRLISVSDRQILVFAP